jgi:predicted RNase H-like HicB family nuclease
MKRSYTVVVERDEDGVYIAEVPALRSCYTQGKSVAEAMERIKEVIKLCEKEQEPGNLEFVSLQKLEVPA